jgi:hypothetical protein
VNSDDDINIDDSYDEYDNTKRKSRKRKLEKSDSDIISPYKTRGRPAKQNKITTPSITSNDSNHSLSTKSKTYSRNNGSEYQSEDDINKSYDEVPINGALKRNRSGAKCKYLI